MDKVREEQYKNLRECFETNLVNHILGENYYNMGMCIYSCDRIATEDIKGKYDSLMYDNRVFKIIISILFIVIIFLLCLIIKLLW